VRSTRPVEDGTVNGHIREAVPSDHLDLCALFEEVDALHRAHLPSIFQQPAGPARSEEHVLGLIADPSAGLFVAQVGDRLAGLVCVLLREPPEIPLFVRRRYAVVEDLVVQDAFRRAGIGRALMEHAQRWAVAQGAGSIELGVWEFNQDAIEFYRALGYDTVSRRMSKRLHAEP
jgi:ribosomal protein S18 acetylase RimI-like enzyme